jgi:hypothetical protein
LSKKQETQAKIIGGMVQYFLAGLGLYILALFLGSIIKVFFGITFISYQGQDVDVVTYIAYGSIDLILKVIQIFGTAILVMLVWLYNFFIVDIIFEILDFALYIFLQRHTFANVEHIPDSTILALVNFYAGLMDLFSVTAWEILNAGSTLAEDSVRFITGRGRKER